LLLREIKISWHALYVCCGCDTVAKTTSSISVRFYGMSAEVQAKYMQNSTYCSDIGSSFLMPNIQREKDNLKKDIFP
jgi:hypothetical protein